MRTCLHYISDLHLERQSSSVLSRFRRKNPSTHPYSALFIAGDLGQPHRPEFRDFLYQASDIWSNVFYVTGNHEYELAQCAAHMQDIDDQIDSITSKRDNIHVLRDGRVVQWNEYTVIGCTLWTFTLYNTWRQTERNSRHLFESEFLRRTIESATTPIIVMTHYLPSYSLVHPYYMQRYSELDRWASASDHLLTKPVKYWFAGHTHSVYDGFLYDVHVLINAGTKQIRFVTT